MMKTEKISKKVICLLMCIVILIPNLFSFTLAYDDEKTILHKRESVYVNSDAYGKPTIINIYNDFDIANINEINDYGSYNKFQVLTGKNSPNVSGDIITWNVNKEDRKFGYIGTTSLDNISNIPWTFEIKYYLNGKETLASDLIHQKGLVKVEVHAIPNDKAPEYYKNNYMMEIQGSFDMTEYISVNSEDAIESTVGNTKTLTFMILPGQDKIVSIEIGSDDFTMNGLTMGMVPIVGDIQEVIQDLVDDRKKLKDAFKELNSSFDIILNSLSDSGKNIDEVISGLDEFQESLDYINGNTATRNDIIVNLRELLENVSGDFTRIDGNVTKILDEISYLEKRVNESKEVFNNLNKELKNLSSNLEKNEEDLERLEKRSKGVEGDLKTLKNVIASTKNSIGGLNKLIGDIDATSDIDLGAIKGGLTNVAKNAQELGAIAEEAATVDPGLAVEIGTVAQNIGASLSKVSTEMKKAEELMGDTNKNTTSLSKDLKDLQGDLVDLYSVVDEYEDYSKDLPETIKDLNSTIDSLNSMIEIMTKDLDENLNIDNMKLQETLDNLSILLNNMQVLEKNVKKIHSLTQGTLELLQYDINIISEKVHTSTKETIDSTKGLMSTLKGATNQSIPLKDAKNRIYDTIKEESDDIESETNIFNMDPNAEPVSFISEKNENVDKVQIFVQTEAIKDYNFKETEDLEPAKENVSFWDKIIQIFQIIGDFFKKIFSGK